MKNTILLGLSLLLINGETFAQREHNQMVIPMVKEGQKNDNVSNNQIVKYIPKIVRKEYMEYLVKKST